MKNFRQITIGLVSCMVLPIQAETYHWDGSADVTLGSSDNAETTAQDWLSGGLWDDGSSSQSLASWVAGDSAIFGGSAASQTINAGTITIGDMTFGAGADGSGTSGTAYTIAGGTLTLSNSTVTTNTDTTISSSLDGSSSLIKAGAGILTFNNQKTYSGGTTVDAGLLDLTGGGGSGGTIRGTVDVNSGATLRISTGDATGYGTGSDRLATINLNGGTLNVNSVSNQTLGNATINMTGASITGIGGSNIDFFQGSSALNSLASATTSNISGASLQIRQGSGLTIDVADGDAATDLQINSIVKSHGSFTTAPLIKAGAGTLSLTAANTYSGATVVNAGTLKISNTLRSTSSLTANNGATLELGAINMFVGGHGTALADSRVLTADGGTILFNGSMDSRIGNIVLDNGGTLTSNRALTGYDVLLGNTASSAATVTVSGTGAATMNGSGGIHLQGVQNFVVADTTGNTDADLVVSMVLGNAGFTGGDPGGINKTGAGTLLLTGSNSYTGATNVNEGTLVIGNGAGSGSISSGAVSIASGASVVVDRGGYGQVLSNNFSGEGTLRIEAGQDPQFAGDNSNFTGEIIIDGASAQFRTRSASAWSGLSKVTITNGGMASSFSYINTNDVKIGSLWGDGTVRIGGSNTDLYLGGNNLDGEFSGAIVNDAGGSGTVYKNGTGTQTLSGNSGYSGGTVIDGGVIKIGTNTNPLGSGSITINDGGTLDLNGYPAASNAGFAGAITMAGTGSNGQGALTNSGGGTSSGMIQFPTISLSGNASVGGTGNFYMIASGYGASTLTLNDYTLTKTGGNTWYLTNTTVSSGTLQISEGKISQFRASNLAAAAVAFDNTAGATLELNNLNLSAGSISGGGSNGGNINLGTATLSVGGLNSSTNYAGAISGTGSLSKTGSGTLTLSGTNTYTGSTEIVGGTLALSGTGSIASSQLIIGANSTFDVAGVTGGYTSTANLSISGSGTIAGNMTVGGTLSPGNSPGDLTFGDDLTLANTLIIEVTGTSAMSFDRLIGDGSNTLTLGGVLNLDNTGYTPSLNDTVTIFPNWFEIDGSFSSVTGTDLGDGLSWDTSQLTSTGALTVIPEPQTALLGALGALALLRRRK